MSIDTSLVYEGTYDKGFIINDDDIVIAKVKNKLYIKTVEELFILINNIYNQDRPIKDDSFEIMNETITLIRSMVVFL